MQKQLFFVCAFLVILTLLTPLLNNSICTAQQPEDKFIYLPIILKNHDPTQPWHALSVIKAAFPSSVQGGDLLTYTIRYSVVGNEPAPGLTVVDTVPQSTTYQTCDGGPTCNHADGTATWTLGNVDSSTTGVVTMVVQVDNSVISGTMLHNNVTLSDASGLIVTDVISTPIQTVMTGLDVVVVFDMSGSMQFDTNCYGCYEPYGDGTIAWYNLPTQDPDFSIEYPHPAYLHPIPTDHLPSTSYQPGGNPGIGSNQGQLCYGRDNPANDVEYRTISGAGDTRRYVVLEAELYSQNTSRLYGPLRQPGTGYWAIQHTNWQTAYRMLGNTWDPDGSYEVGATPILTYSRGSWVSHHPYVTWAIENVQPFGHDYTLDEARNDPNGVPRLEYDFITANDWDCSSTPNTCPPGSTSPDDTRIWARVQGGGSWGTGRQNIYWAVYDYNSLYAPAVAGDVTQVTPLGSGKIEEIRETTTSNGPNYGGADGNKWQWRELTGSSTALNLENGKRYTLIVWAGRVGYDIDQIVIENDDSTAFTSNYTGGATTLQATRGSAFRQACNRCNPIYGLTITQTTDCDPPSDNGAYDPFIFVNGTDLSDPAVNPLYGGYQPLRDAKEAVKHLIQKFNPQFHQVGLVGYSSGTPAEGRVELRCWRRYSAQQCFQGTNPIGYTEVLQVLETLPPDGSTNMAEGMLRSLEMLGINANDVETNTWAELNDCDSSTDHCSRGGAAKRVMIIMSDGVANMNPWDSGNPPYTPGSGIASQNCYANDLYQPNTGHQMEDRAKDCVMYYAQIAANYNVTMYTIGLGAGADANLLQTVAELPGSNGQYFAAVSSAELDAIYDAIMQTSQ
jgi:uncharacterized repeat protein (TIGR01451 family)